MANQLRSLLSNYFTEPKVDMYVECDDILQSYGHQDHIEKIMELINLPIVEDVFKLTPEIESIFSSSCHDILLKQFIVPVKGSFNMYHKLITGMYQLENSFESEMILEVIDENEQVTTARDTLCEILEAVCDIPWDYCQEHIVEVRNTLIKLLKKLHGNKVRAEVEPRNDAPMSEERLQFIRDYISFWKEQGDPLIIAEYINTGRVTVPAKEETVLTIMTMVLYALTDTDIIARELVGMASVLPIKITSIGTQAKRFNNSIHAGQSRMIMDVNLSIDNTLRKLK